MKIQIRKLSEKAKTPVKSHTDDAGYDLFATSKQILIGKYIEYSTGIAMAIPVGYVGLIFPRSSIRDKKLILSNCVGVIDPGYIGEIKASFRMLHKPNEAILEDIYDVGDRCCQIIIVKTEDVVWEEVIELPESSRNQGGHGSTGK